MTDKYDVLFKIIVVGDSGVGKSNIITRYVDESFTLESKTTIGVEYYFKTCIIDDLTIKLQIWDTAGQERFRSIITSYYRGASGVLLIYDITKINSFNNINRWIDDIKKGCDENAVIMLVGNKADLENLRTVNSKLALDFAKHNDMLFCEASALDDFNIQTAFDDLVIAMAQKNNVQKNLGDTPYNKHMNNVLRNTKDHIVIKLDDEDNKDKVITKDNCMCK